LHCGTVLFQAHRLEVKSQLPEEPQEDAGNGITKIRFRLPKGECLDRRFQATAPLKVCSTHELCEF